ncbi:hypothetical protein, partial [Escherichia coli]
MERQLLSALESLQTSY